jgi:hypothetical protein
MNLWAKLRDFWNKAHISDDFEAWKNYRPPRICFAFNVFLSWFFLNFILQYLISFNFCIQFDHYSFDWDFFFIIFLIFFLILFIIILFLLIFILDLVLILLIAICLVFFIYHFIDWFFFPIFPRYLDGWEFCFVIFCVCLLRVNLGLMTHVTSFKD